jgi:glycerophosphoryl diester phosphodiesterase
MWIKTRKRMKTLSIIVLMVLSACSQTDMTALPENLPPEQQTTPPSFSQDEEQKPMKPPLIIAHRGARSLAPENTLAAARKAFEAGADMWELDVSVTADGELFIMHDDTLERTCNAREVFPDRRPWNVYDFTLAEIRQLDCGTWFTFEDPFQQIAAGNVSVEDQQAYKGEKAPTLREALELTKANNKAVNIEIKEQPDEATARLAVEKTVALVAELGMDDGKQVVISSFEHEYLRHARELNSHIPIQILTKNQIPDLESYLASFGTNSVNPKLSTWNYKQLKAFSDQGILANVWTVNEAEEMKALADANVNGIITDFPQVLRALLQE